MRDKHGNRIILLAALVVASMRLWSQFRGTTKTPFPSWAIGWGATFFLLSILNDFVPGWGSGVAVVAAMGDVLANGKAVFSDVSTAIQQSEQGQPIFTGSIDTPSQTGTMSPTGDNQPITTGTLRRGSMVIPHGSAFIPHNPAATGIG